MRFFGHRRWLRATACVHIIYGHRAICSTGPRGQPGINPWRDCAEIVRKSCNVSAVSVQSPHPPHGNRTEPLRGSAFARCPCGENFSLMPSSHLACDGSTEPVSCPYTPFRAASARPPCGGRRRLWDFRTDSRAPRPGGGGGGYSDVVWTGVRGWSLQTRTHL